MSAESLGGWLTVNGNLRYCRLLGEHLDIFTDNSLSTREFSIELSKIVDAIGSNDKEFELLPENSPELHFTSEDVGTIQKWRNSIFKCINIECLHQNIPNLSDFKLIKIIGEGYSGKVHLVSRKSDDKLFALKLIQRQKLIGTSSINRTITERNILIHIKFPFITKIYSAFQTDTYLVLALEYVGGGDLQHHLDKGVNFTSKQIKLYLAQLVLALEHLHSMGIVFRDMKPSNILISKDGSLKLTDFGLAKNISNSSTTRTMCGTHEYLSPEMINGEQYDFSVDWWAFGVIAYRLICGFLPFNSPNLLRLYDKISKCCYRIPARINEDAKQFICGLLKRDPRERFTLEQIKNHKYFDGIDWQKVYKKEYTMDFVPFKADDDSAFNFDTGLFDPSKYNQYENEYEASDSCSISPSSSNWDLCGENNGSFIKDFSFSSSYENFDDDF